VHAHTSSPSTHGFTQYTRLVLHTRSHPRHTCPASHTRVPCLYTLLFNIIFMHESLLDGEGHLLLRYFPCCAHGCHLYSRAHITKDVLFAAPLAIRFCEIPIKQSQRQIVVHTWLRRPEAHRQIPTKSLAKSGRTVAKWFCKPTVQYIIIHYMYCVSSHRIRVL
jgi:hypothetical protein